MSNIINWLKTGYEPPFWIVIQNNDTTMRVKKVKNFASGINLILASVYNFWELEGDGDNYRLQDGDALTLIIGKQDPIQYGETIIFENDLLELKEEPFIQVKQYIEDNGDYSDWIICKSTDLTEAWQ